MKNISTKFTREYGVKYPIASAPMAFVGTPPDLALAVCRAGGIGSMAMGPLYPEAVRNLIRSVRNSTNLPFNINFITPRINEEQINICIEEGVPIVSCHWGNPPVKFIKKLHDSGIKVWEQVGSVESAVKAAESGVDLIVAQGSEAGGHNFGILPVFVLVPQLVDAVNPVPVLAAGGISTGRQMLAALALGADGVSIGTRFVASEEAFAHPVYKNKLVEAQSYQTRLTSIYGPDMPEFNPMRVLDTGLAKEYAGRENEAPKNLESQSIIASMKFGDKRIDLRRFTSFVPTADTEGNIEEMPFLAGQGVGFIKGIKPVGEIISEIMSEAVSALGSLVS